MKKLLSILMGVGLILILVGCSSQETATLVQKLDNAEFFVTYTYDKNKDTVTKIKTELNQSSEFTIARKENEELFNEIKGIDGVETSITEKDGKDIFLVEVDLTKFQLSKIKESNSVFFKSLIQRGFLTEDGDKVSFSKSKEAVLQHGYTEQKK